MKHDGKNSNTENLRQSMDALRKSIDRMPKNYPKLFLPGPTWKKLILKFLQGVAYGLGFLAAASIVIPLMLYILRQVEWVPLAGDIVSEIVERVEEMRGSRL